MRLSPFLTCTALTLFTCAAPASAQEHPFGVSIGYPGSIGFLWQPAVRIAVRPSINFRQSGSGPLNDVGDFESSSSSTNISALLYLRPSSPLRLYLAPRYSFTRTSSTSSIQVPQLQFPPGTISSTTITSHRSVNEHGVAGLFGVEYRAGERFGVFGEVGVLHTRASLSSSSDNWAVGSTSGVGVAVYF
jgi:hypothetical protein